MIEGSDLENWNKVWFVGSAYENHMSPVRSLFKQLKESFKMLDVEEDERKIIFSYGVGEAYVETKEDYMVTRKHNRCIVRYMFDEKKDTVDMEEKSGMDCGKSSKIIEEHNEYLEKYFDSIDPKEQCMLVKGIENLKMVSDDEYDYIDDQYVSMNGTLYAMKVLARLEAKGFTLPLNMQNIIDRF
nr:ARID DNA-binding domain-containing protein [Tanacetum cinerariifolium]